jgi:beta-galactosidase
MPISSPFGDRLFRTRRQPAQISIQQFMNVAPARWLAIGWACFLMLGFNWPLSAQTYVPPTSPRANIILDSGWRFIRQDVAGAQTNGFDDSNWTNLNLPHTWNNLDGQDGGGNYYRGIGWYRRHYMVDGSYTNQHFFIKFDGAFCVADVYVNGTLLGEHQGGFGAFVFDATTNLNVGTDNVIAVQVNNAANTNIPPLDADFTFFGGLYRDAHLLVTDPLQISPLDYGSPGVYLKPTNVSSNSANLQVTTVVSNANPVAADVTVRTVITDAATNIVAILTNLVMLPADSLSNVVASTVIANPHLWNGLADPYLYQAFVELYNGTNLTDLVSQPLGFRWFSIDPTNGFFLNGQPYDLHGVAMHQDWLNCGWALTNAQRDTNFLLIKDLGATAVRLSHYEHDDYTYQLADQDGIILWSEIPLIDRITESPAFYTNAEQQLRELIRQRYNHPSVICWSVFNEITLESGPTPTNLVQQLVQLEAQEDSTRPSVGATLAGNGDATSWMPQDVAFNEYFGWYESPVNGIASWSDSIHAAHPTNSIGITEYGAGASIYQHSENPVVWPTTTGGLYHPEEWQDLVHETNWALMKARPSLWFKTVWNMADFASDGRDEGDTPGRNDKGLVTYDRQTRKDAFYFYQANWTTNPMLYITGHTFTNRLTNFITAKVYANCDSVELFVNGVSQGSHTGTDCVFTWPVMLAGGSNYVQAIGTKGSTNVTDSLTWLAPSGLAITSPLSSVVYLNSTNATLLLSAAITNSSEPVSVLWSQVSGPGASTFSSSNAFFTTVSFSGTGIYGLNVTAKTGTSSANAGMTVVVGSAGNVTNGLLAWWRMDETGGGTAFDSSGNGRNAAVNGATFTTGYLSNALYFNGSGNDATFASPDTTQITVAAWARATGLGNSLYPRILETAGYRFFFRFDSVGSDGFDFATFTSTTNGDWFSGQNTLSTGAWYHVAASYDRSSLTNVPTLYVDGTKENSPLVVTSPAGVTPASSGTGYIGNRAALDRAWSGDIDDLRIYNRLLSDAEVQVLASMPMTNLAPIVSAGTNQTIIWPASASLNGAVTDDGNPNPPGVVTVTWNQLTGPGTVTFANPNAAATPATFSAPGAYTLQLTANDGQVETVSSVAVTALIQPAISIQPLSGALQLSWPTGGAPWRLQAQTNPLTLGLSTNWQDVIGATNPFTVPLNFTNGSVFYRLISP